MTGQGVVETIHIAPEATAAMIERESVEAVAGSGLKGDRYFNGNGTFSAASDTGRELTLTEAEAIEAIKREQGISIGFNQHRRNITTRGIALNHLVGETFQIGAVRCQGINLCEPCDHLERLTVEGINDALTHRGGLRANILEGGTIRAGDRVEQR